MPIKGLGLSEHKKLLEQYGPNKLPDPKTTPPLILFASQFKNFFSGMLAAAIILSFIVGDFIDAVLIFLILILNSGLSFWQEYKATREIAMLRKFESPKSRVIRDGHEIEVPSENLVPGDIVILEAGNKIPADGILVNGYEIEVNESALTGESVPVEKSTTNNLNELFLGTWLTRGQGHMKITSTGKNTKFGKIAQGLGVIVEEETPLETSLNSLAIKIGILTGVIALVLAILSVLQGAPLLEVLLSSMALIVAAVPEGLPAIITVLLAIGARRMYRRKSLIRKMSSIENLGATDVICIDKTGTITKNEMTVRKIQVDKENLSDFITVAVVCNTANLNIKEGEKAYDISGDSMEGALLTWSLSQNADINLLREGNKIIKEIPFDSKRKMMSVIVKNIKGTSLLAKGAPEVIIPLCKLNKAEKIKLEKQYRQMAKNGLRILAFAMKSYKGSGSEIKEEKELEFLGFVAIADEPRPEANSSIATARKAGIEIVMITGDNELTAKAIAEEVNLLKKGDEIITGKELDNLTDEALKKRINNIRVYARTTPEHKLRIVNAFQEMGKIVAVTGDGVNDSLALKKAHIGISMGRAGTDVAKEASDIIILDDNLSTIIAAVEEGRLIYKNIVKVVRFLLTGNLSEVLLITIITLLGYPIPLLPVQILWINFVTDGLPAISLAADRVPAKEMLAPPRGKDNSLFDLKTVRFVSVFGIIISLTSVAAFIFGMNEGGLDYARRFSFTTMIVSQMFLVLFVIRKGYALLSNKYLLLSVVVILLVQFLILTFPPFSHIFGI